ncbi:GNAT family N-acetyltransferase [Psychrobium sp. MM17-31]|uniref:GNAT family N-acetyltransferase n=1 Tax=Psychrobium sp. MM17-31 TaxID=2917758 RepID=UPI001EF6B90D|nr:GNAT family N-acetyltransferase [Psychrobium sp. MM17-31]MCG7531775.1 GNAT family N-acetyltransferase [Psychrobium sp. MM17-31]
MDISLKPIIKANYEAVCDLDVAESQQDFVACNMWSLVEAQFNEGYVTRAIYQAGNVVGFFMWVKETPSKISIWRFMVDEKFQKQGIGRFALELALAEIKTDTAIREIEICYNPNNPVAKDFYASFGFSEVGMDEDDEDMLAVIHVSP